MLLCVFTPACITMSICAFKGVCVRVCACLCWAWMYRRLLRSPRPTPSTRTLLALGQRSQCSFVTASGRAWTECLNALEQVCVRARARLTEWVIEMGPQRGQMEIITEGRDGKGGDERREGRGGGKGLAWTLVLNKVALKAKFIKAYPHDTSSASCLRVKGGIRERVGPGEDRGKDVRNGRKKGLRKGWV